MINPTFKDFLPQGEEIQNLQDQIVNGRMVHALLITGDDGTGKRTLSQVIAAAVLCQSAGKRPCGKCSSCTRVFSNEHPDLVTIEKGNPLTGDTRKSRTSIPIEDIREMIRRCSVYPLEGGNRVVLIRNADDMTAQAQNCLLKILEEPPPNTYFVLTSGHPDSILVTVRSRCRFLKMKPWKEEYIVSALCESGIDTEKARLAAHSSHGSIGYAEKLAADEGYWEMRQSIISSFFNNSERSTILSTSSRWKENKGDTDKLFDILEECIRLMLRFRFFRKDEELLKGFSDKWRFFAENADYQRFLILLDRISEARKRNEYNVSIQAIVDQLLLSFMGEI